MPIIANAVPDALRPLIDAGETVRFAVVGDLDRERRFARVDLAITDRRLICAEGGRIVVGLNLGSITEAKVDELFGSGRMIATTDDGDRLIAYHSRMVAPEFATFCRLVNDVVGGRPPLLPDSQPAAYCARCAAPLRDREAPCGLCVPRLQIIRRLMGLLKPYRQTQIWLTLVVAATCGMQLVVPLFMRGVVDQGILGKDAGRLNMWVALMAGSGFVLFGLRFAHGRLMSWLSGRLIADVRSTLHSKIQRLRLSYLNKRDGGELSSRVLSDTGQLQHFLVEGVPFFALNLMMMFGAMAILIAIDPWLTLLALFPAPLVFFGGAYFSHKLMPMHHRQGSRNGVLHAIVGESLQGIRTVKAFSQQGRRVEMFDNANERHFETAQQINRTWVGFSASMPWIMGLAGAGMWYVGGHRIVGGSALTLGDMIAFGAYMGSLYGPLQWFTEVFNWMSNALSAAERIFSVLDEPTEEALATAGATPAAPVDPSLRFRGEIEFKDVRFSYERGKEVLKGISFRLPAGQMVGLVGKSGSGKSTIINLISRFYDPDAGQILIDGTPVEGHDVSRVRRSIGVVMQDPFVFNASILENIRFGRPDATFEDVMRATRAANAHEFILDKEDGYDTLIGEGGAQLSGGERQRVSIARAILDDPPVLILDEATSAVDSETERAIQEAIAVLIKGRTTIAIAHRLATLRNAHHLLVMDDGKLVEEGTHEELLAKADGVFAKLVRLQNE
nr:ABC transporter ATP-binding protein [Planctomycetota bacterium]